ncbi:hypothetical protein G4B88_008684 [Cannabis sativa]|uniref:Uncharacterized protein n=1 Tax=Cannabis sativa TaxID=3483 RepID=A0A7J6ELU6_CANSA|nr:hypothetical protein G4B88_008684 [Cannabis sativa]
MNTLPDNQYIQLTEEEALIHDFDHVSIHPEPQAHSFCLVVKILSPKTLKADWIHKAMKDAWIGDRRRVMEGQPWHFDRSLMIFAIPDGFDTILPNQLRFIPLLVQVHLVPFGSRSYSLAQFVVDTIGDLIEVHIASLYDAITPFMCVRVLLDTTKPLHRGMNVHFRKLFITKWLKLLYEGIQNYCYHYSKLDHTFNKCEKFLHHCDNHPFPPSLSYKDALRAPAKSEVVDHFLVPSIANTTLTSIFPTIQATTVAPPKLLLHLILLALPNITPSLQPSIAHSPLVLSLPPLS